MITTYKEPYRDGELRIGWASWDNGEFKSRSIKYAYPDSSGKISRGSPELPLDILVDMLVLASDQKELQQHLPQPNASPPSIKTAGKAELKEEKRLLATALMRLQQLVMELPWANWQPIYDQLGKRYDDVKAELAARP